MNQNRLLVMSGICTIVFTVLLILSIHNVTSVTVQDQNNNSHQVRLPHSFDAPTNSTSTWTLKIIQKPWTLHGLHIIPDDLVQRITVNGTHVFLDHIEKSELQDSQKGFHFDFGPYLHPGENTIRIVLKNFGGPTGLKIRPSYKGLYGSLLVMLCVVSFSAFLFLLSKRLRFSTAVSVMLLAGLLIRLLYLGATAYDVRGHDTMDHLQYINYILQHLSLPDKAGGWAYYHPPLYYITAAALYPIFHPLQGNTVNLFIALKGLQIVSLLLNMVFLGAGIKLIELSMPEFRQTPVPIRVKQFLNSRFLPVWRVPELSLGKILHGCAILLLVFWPSVILHSVRIGNDAMLYPLYTLGLLYILKWMKYKKRSALYISAVFAVLSVMTKTNAVTLMGVIAVTYLFETFSMPDWRSYFRQRLKQGLVVALIFSVGLGVAFSGSIKGLLQGKTGNLIVGNSHQLSRKLIVGNRASNYLYFDFKNFIDQPFTWTFSDGFGREYFWNFLLKTSLFGEFRFHGKAVETSAIVLSFLLIGLLMYIGIWAFLLKRPPDRDILFHALNTFSLVAAVMGLRIMLPFACSNDFRYIIPVLPSVIILFVHANAEIGARDLKMVSYTGIAGAAMFSLLSVLFILSVVVLK